MKRKPVKPVSAKKAQDTLINEATHDSLYGTLILLSCANAASQLLEQEHGFTREKAVEFANKMIPLAVTIGAESMGQDPEQLAKIMTVVFSGGITNVAKDSDAVQET